MLEKLDSGKDIFGGGDAVRELDALLRVVCPHHAPVESRPAYPLRSIRVSPIILIVLVLVGKAFPQPEQKMPIPRPDIQKARLLNVQP